MEMISSEKEGQLGFALLRCKDENPLLKKDSCRFDEKNTWIETKNKRFTRLQRDPNSEKFLLSRWMGVKVHCVIRMDAKMATNKGHFGRSRRGVRVEGSNYRYTPAWVRIRAKRKQCKLSLRRFENLRNSS